MEIKTKFDTGDTVYFLYGNKVHTGDVVMINIHKIFSRSIGIKYRIHGLSQAVDRAEHELFKTKEELIKSL